MTPPTRNKPKPRSRKAADGTSRALVLPRPIRSLRHQIAESLRNEIVYGDLHSGQPLVEEELSERFQTSRGPVREALRQLEQEGLVASYPYHRTVVADFATSEVTHVLLPIRNTLEQYALAHALPRLTEADFAALQDIVDQMVAAGQTENLPHVVELDIQFHRLLMERSEQFQSLQLWNLLSPRVRGVFYRMGPFHDTLGNIGAEHQKLLAVLRRRDIDTAIGALSDHIAERSLYGRVEEPVPDASTGDHTT
jgi:DNA-binding GntR family transcriptional regulator